MLYRIYRGGVEGYQRDQAELVYLVTRLSHIIRAGLDWVATDRNAAVDARYTQKADELHSHIDWDIMEAERWANTEDDGFRKQRRMAELLVHRAVPWPVLSHIYAQNQATVDAVSTFVADQGHRPAIAVRAQWYF